MYEVKTDDFSGPIEKLVELIEEKKMDVTQVSLAAVTADFLRYVEELRAQIREHANDESAEAAEARLLADFLVVAAHLILVKSKALLPALEISTEEEEGIAELEKRLKMYQELKPLFVQFRTAWQVSGRSLSRTALFQFQPVFYPPANVDARALYESFGNLVNALSQFLGEHETIERQLISLESKIGEVSERITRGVFSFSDASEGKSREEVIVLFLAILHLLRDKIVQVRQESLFGDIAVEGENKECRIQNGE